MSDEQPTCGKGLAAHASLPRTMAEVASAMAEVLDHHRASLDPTDPATRAEDDAYATLTRDFRGIAKSLRETADRMAGYRDLPMPRHDESVLMTDEVNAKYEAFRRAERDLLDLLQTSFSRDRDQTSNPS